MTSKGSALHLACRLNKFIFANGLMNANSDCELKNNDGYLPVDLTTNEEIVKLFHYKIKKTKDNQSKSQINLTSLNSDNNYPEKPPIIKGEMYKIGEMRIALNRRFFVLNAEEGTLIRFMKKSDFPLKPL